MAGKTKAKKKVVEHSGRKRLAVSALGVTAAAGLAVGVNMLADRLLSRARIDLTENSLYTLSDGTRQVLTGLDDTIIGLALVHTVLALPFSVLITFSLFAGIPVELEEAAWTLGCTRLQAFRRIVLPLAVPGIAASGVFAFVTSWNEVFAASVLTIRNQTLTAFLLTSLDVSPLPLKFAGALVLVVPALIFLFFIRKYLFSLWGIANR